MRLISCFAAMLFLVCGSVYASTQSLLLQEPFLFQSASPLRQGQKSLRFLTWTEQMSTQFDGPGGPSLEKELGQVDSSITAVSPSFAYGLTDRWTLQTAVPFYYLNSAVSGNSVVSTPNWISAAESANGYNPVDRQAGLLVGDTTIQSKYLLERNLDYALSFTNFLIVPTGKPPDVDNLADVRVADGAFALGAGAVADWYASKKIILTSELAYLTALPDEVAERIPLNSQTVLTPDVDRHTQRQLGNSWQAAVGGRFRAGKGIVLGADYAYRQKAKDSYSGHAYPSSRYQLLANDTDFDLQAGQLRIGYSTLDKLYNRDTPIAISGCYTRILAGHNVGAEDAFSAQVEMYF